MEHIANTETELLANAFALSFTCKICEVTFDSKATLDKHELKHVAPGGFICRDCKSRFVTDRELAMHRELAHKITCSDCGAAMRKTSLLVEHRLTKCGTYKRFECFECHAKFLSITSLRAHSTIHYGQKPHVCAFCAASFLSRGQLKVHERCHTGEKPFKCDKCPKAFAYRESLVTHRSVHTGVKPYICQVCNKRFSCIGNLLKHRRTRSGVCAVDQNAELTKCAPRASAKLHNPSKASNGFVQQEQLVQQQYMSEEDVVMNIEIEYAACDGAPVVDVIDDDADAFDVSLSGDSLYTVEYDDAIDMDEPQQEELRASSVVGDLDDDDPALNTTAPEFLDYEEDEALDDAQDFVESQTELRLNDMDIVYQEADDVAECNMKVEEEHAQNSPSKSVQAAILDDFKPNVVYQNLPDKNAATRKRPAAPVRVECDPSTVAALHTSVRLKQRSASANKKCDEFRCAKCGRTYFSRSGLNDHENSQCGQRSKHRCTVCDKSYASAGSLKTHMSVHTGELAHSCAYCDKTFRTNGEKKVHERKHNGDKPFKCQFCDKSFGYRESLLTHISTHTGVKRFQCQGCEARFSCITNLQRHWESHLNTCAKAPRTTKAVLE